MVILLYLPINREDKKVKKKRKLSVNAVCFIIAGLLAIGVPGITVLANDITTSKRADSGLQSTGNVECLDSTGTKTILFAVEDLYYLENRIVDELAVVCE